MNLLLQFVTHDDVCRHFSAVIPAYMCSVYSYMQHIIFTVYIKFLLKMTARASKKNAVIVISVIMVTVLYFFVIKQSNIDSSSLYFEGNITTNGLTPPNVLTKLGKEIDLSNMFSTRMSRCIYDYLLFKSDLNCGSVISFQVICILQYWRMPRTQVMWFTIAFQSAEASHS